MSWNQVSVNNPCQICGAFRGCAVSEDETRLSCWREQGRGYLYTKNGAHIHKVYGDDEGEESSGSSSEEQSTRESLPRPRDWVISNDNEFPHDTSPEILNEQYEQLLLDYPLSDADAHHLREERGIDPLPGEYGTLYRKKPDRDSNLARSYSLPNAIPGFFMGRHNRYLNVYHVGLMIPHRDYYGNIVAIQLRTDNPESKYVYLSSKPTEQKNGFIRFPSGASPGIQCHVEHPVNRRDDRVFITEGVFKSKAVAKHLSALCIAVPGHTTYEKALPIIRQVLSDRNVDNLKVVIAFDKDKNVSTQYKVERSVHHLASLLDEHYVSVAEWNPVHFTEENERFYLKGIDDLLNQYNSQVDGILSYRYLASPKYMTLDAARCRLGRLFRDIINTELYRGKFVIPKATTGVGKNHCCRDELVYAYQNNCMKKALLVFDNYQILKEFEQGLKDEKGIPLIDYAVLMGRSPDSDSPFFCDYRNETLLAGSAGKNIFSTVCRTCPKLQNCSYHHSVHTVMNSKVVLTVKHCIFNLSDRLSQFDLLVVDEAFHNWLYDTRSFTLNELEKTLNVFRQYRGSFDEHIRWLEQTISLIKLEDSRSHPCPPEFRQEVRSIDNMFAFNPDNSLTLEEGETDLSIKNLEFSYIKRLFEDLERSVAYIDNRQQLWVSTPRWNIIEMMKNVTTINLDATPIIPLLQPLNPIVMNFNVKQNVIIKKLIGKPKLTKRQLLSEEGNTNYLSKVCQAIEAIIEREPDCALFTHLAVKNKLAGLLDDDDKLPDVKRGHYGANTRASNAYKEYQTYIILGAYIESLSYTFTQTMAMCMVMWNKRITYEEYIDRINSYFDDVVRAKKRAELDQTIGRARAIYRQTPATFYILSGDDFGGLRVNEPIWSLESLYGEESYHRAREKALLSQVVENCIERYGFWLYEFGFVFDFVNLKKTTSKQRDRLKAWNHAINLAFRDVYNNINNIYTSRKAINTGQQMCSDTYREHMSSLQLSPQIKKSPLPIFQGVNLTAWYVPEDKEIHQNTLKLWLREYDDYLEKKSRESLRNAPYANSNEPELDELEAV